MLLEFVRFGGISVSINLVLGVILILLLPAGYILAFIFGREKPDGIILKIWGHLTLGTGFIATLLGFLGTVFGLINIYNYANSVGLGGPMGSVEFGAVMAQGMFEVTFNFLLGFFLGLLAIFGYLSVRLVARRSNN